MIMNFPIGKKMKLDVCLGSHTSHRGYPPSPFTVNITPPGANPPSLFVGGVRKGTHYICSILEGNSFWDGED